jgi:hypothetical protein
MERVMTLLACVAPLMRAESSRIGRGNADCAVSELWGHGCDRHEDIEKTDGRGLRGKTISRMWMWKWIGW